MSKSKSKSKSNSVNVQSQGQGDSQSTIDCNMFEIAWRKLKTAWGQTPPKVRCGHCQGGPPRLAHAMSLIDKNYRIDRIESGSAMASLRGVAASLSGMVSFPNR